MRNIVCCLIGKARTGQPTGTWLHSASRFTAPTYAMPAQHLTGPGRAPVRLQRCADPSPLPDSLVGLSHLDQGWLLASVHFKSLSANCFYLFTFHFQYQHLWGSQLLGPNRERCHVYKIKGEAIFDYMKRNIKQHNGIVWNDGTRHWRTLEENEHKYSNKRLKQKIMFHRKLGLKWERENRVKLAQINWLWHTAAQEK